MKDKDISTVIIFILFVAIVFGCIYGIVKIEEYHCKNKGGTFIKSYTGDNKCVYGGSYGKD